MQTLIVIVIVIGAALLLIRRFHNHFTSKDTQSPCGCSCDGCSPHLKDDCSDIKNPSQ